MEREAAIQWWRGLDRHSQWLAIERWRALGEEGSDRLAALIQNSPEHIERIWALEKAREMRKADQEPGENLKN
jgi:hypothetical protein